MVELVTAARPYARAAFSFALESDSLKQWANALQCFALVSSEARVKSWLDQPNLSVEDKVSGLKGLLEGDQVVNGIDNFLTLIVQNHRTKLFAEIYTLYREYMFEHESRTSVVVTSANPLSSEQEKALVEGLSRKLGGSVSISTQVNKELLGGVHIQAGDISMDYSVRGRLARLVQTLI